MSLVLLIVIPFAGGIAGLARRPLERDRLPMGRPRRLAGGPGPGGVPCGRGTSPGRDRGRGRRAGGCRGRRSARRRLVRAPLRRLLDTSGRHPLPPGRRRPEPHHADAHFRRGDPGAALVVDERPAAHRPLPLPAHVGGRLSGRRVHGSRPVPVLLLLRDDARAVLLPGRPLGARAAPAGGHQVLHLHAGRRAAHAHLHRGPVLPARAADPASTPSTTCSCSAPRSPGGPGCC